MYTIVLLVAIFSVCGAQQYSRDPQTAAILTDARYLSGDGKFGASYTQEDGVQFKEETDADGNRQGAYSYVDPTGVRRTVSYTAGKNGFQASGDHLPVAPAAPAVPQQPLPQYNYQPQNPAPPPYPQNPYSQNPYPQNPYPQNPYPQNPYPQNPYPQNAIPQYTTPPPTHRFFPPGKLDLNRTPDGFSYSFSKS